MPSERADRRDLIGHGKAGGMEGGPAWQAGMGSGILFRRERLRFRRGAFGFDVPALGAHAEKFQMVALDGKAGLEADQFFEHGNAPAAEGDDPSAGSADHVMTVVPGAGHEAVFPGFLVDPLQKAELAKFPYGPVYRGLADSRAFEFGDGLRDGQSFGMGGEQLPDDFPLFRKPQTGLAESFPESGHIDVGFDFHVEISINLVRSLSIPPKGFFSRSRSLGRIID